MGLPINIEELINGNTVEWERLEFKKGFNPEVIIHSMCAFANDFQNWGGGYIIIGIDEDQGQPVLPPEGLQQSQLDAFQKKVLELGHKMSPAYFPIAQPYLIEDKHILVLWCPGGDSRPYTAPESFAKDSNQRQAYIRITSNSIKAQGANLQKLQELAARLPFDDRINYQATLDDLNLGLIQAYLQEIKSDLFSESYQIGFEELCRSMQIVRGAKEDCKVVNVGLLFFCKNPEKFFKRAWIELVVHADHTGKNFKEIYFKGPIHHQLKDVLSYLETNIIEEVVIKDPLKAKAKRYFNFPYDALEEALSNAVYHKSYEVGSPIEVQIFQDQITILSHPGPMPPVTAKILSTKKRIVAREYRNRRIGDFFKEIGLTEGRGTGFPTIYDSMLSNESPEPTFETDESSYVLVSLPSHKSVRNSNGATNEVKALLFNNLEDIVNYANGVANGATNGARDGVKTILNSEIHKKVQELLSSATTWIKREELFKTIGLSNQSTNRKKYLDPLIELNWIEMEFPDSPTNPNQRYKTTHAGTNLLKLIDE